jgi:type IV secretion system protein VirB9
MKCFPVLLALFAALAASAATGARASDSRIRDIRYDDRAVTSLRGCSGFQLTIEFEPSEQIENIAVGDAMRWQVTPNKRSNLIFLKPSSHASLTNMTVVTDRRRYNFELSPAGADACARGDVVYDLRFTYPAEKTAQVAEAAPPPPPPEAAPQTEEPPPGERNDDYSYTGVAANVPQRAFDDGRSTYLRWADGVAAPAIYTLGPDKSEALVNYSVRGDYVVVDQVSPAFVLRRGNQVAVLYNDAYQRPKLDAAGPRPRSAAESHKHRSNIFAWLFGRRSKEASE